MDLRPSVGKIPWKHPLEQPPPIGVKLFVLTVENIAIVSNWDWDGKFAGWHELFDVPESIKTYQKEMRGYY